MNEHESIRKLLPLAASDDLSPEDLQRVRRHLADCAACRGASEDFAALGGALRGLPTPQPRAEVLARVREQAQAGLERRRKREHEALIPGLLVAASWIMALATWPGLRAGMRWIVAEWPAPAGGIGFALAAYTILGFFLACLSAVVVGRLARAAGRIR
jgi:predicted anti-sigma-YlaC factor YlaD